MLAISWIFEGISLKCLRMEFLISNGIIRIGTLKWVYVGLNP